MRRHKAAGTAVPGSQGSAVSKRNRIAALVALATAVGLGVVFYLAGSRNFLMPGPLQSGHGSIESCHMCHTKSGEGKLSWLHGLVAGDPVADSRACLSCHKMPDSQFNAHGASDDILRGSTERLAKYAADLKRVPTVAQAQSVAFPTQEMAARGLHCATCHHEHQGAAANLKNVSNAQCRSCHVVKFDSFDGQHPAFSSYPFKKRTKIIYDHAGHFGKHYPEIAKKEPSKRVPESCSSCHLSDGDRRVMAVAPFERTCATCHLEQITGDGRATGPKGIAFIALPGIDLNTLRTRNGAIGEWPEGSEAELTPFMKVMISRSPRGQALLQSLAGVNLQDLSSISDTKIKAVAELVWEIKSLFFALISGKTPDVFGELKRASGAALNAEDISKLTAGLPRDVLLATQQRYLPNLAAEMTAGPGARVSPAAHPGAAPAAAAPKPEPDPDQPSTSAEPADSSKHEEASEPLVAPSQAANPPLDNPQTCLARVLGQCLLFKSDQGDAGAARSQNGARVPRSDGGPAAQPLRLGGPTRAGVKNGRPGLPPEARPDNRPGTRSTAQNSAPTQPKTVPQKSNKSAQKDDLLFPTEAERRAIDGHRKQAGREAQRDQAPSASAAPPAAAAASPVGSDVDAENWARHGGWYQQDHAIYYRPAGHKDMFIYTWLTLTGALAPVGARSATAAVFEALAAKEAQGSCTKCHSIDDSRGARGGQGRRVNFSPLTAADKRGQFTRFIHQPHLGVVADQGCLTCHNLEKGRSYLKGYEQGNPRIFDAEFSAVKRESCTACHADGKVRQDCLLCHAYHINGVFTPAPKTTLRPP